MQKHLVTPALPYANGPIHLGHLLEHVQVNIFVQALRMARENVVYVCGADSHGTPIEMNALKASVTPEDFAKEWQKKQEESFKAFGIEFDGGYGSTHTKENEAHAQKIFQELTAKDLIKKSEIEQLFDPELKRFLPDRMVKGTCPKCKATDQYGDSCEACGRTYQPSELIEPRSALSGAKPITKKSVHYFVNLDSFRERLQAWLKGPKVVHDDTRAFLEHWFKEGLRDWDISRDGPYFGFKIPGEADKFFYVWLDAPVGYISLTEIAAKDLGQNVADYWQDKSTKITHFIGKDIVYFHTLFWPAMLMAANYTLPSQIIVHGMLTIDGQKMSKSRGTFILADTFSRHVNPEALRYYYACKLSRRIEDIDLNLGDFVQRVNTDLVNKVVNLISRALPLLHRYFQGQVGHLDKNASGLIKKAEETIALAKGFYLDNEPNRAIHEIVRLAEDANKYLQDEAPWKVVSEDKDRAQAILTTGVYVGKICFGLLKPVLPKAVAKLEDMVHDGKPFTFDNLGTPFAPGSSVKPYEHLFNRIESENIDKMIEESKPSETTPTVQKSEPHIDFDLFMKVDLRAAKVLEAKAVEGSDKLIACRLDVGSLGIRNVFSGLRPHVAPEELLGKTVVVVANLAPRKMRFGISEGMILACGDERPCPIYVDKAAPGERVR